MRAYVLIDASLNTSREIVTELRKKNGIIVADVVNGPHQIITCIEGKDPASIAQTILFDIRKINGVKDLTVYLGINEGQELNRPCDEPDILFVNTSKTLHKDKKSKTSKM